MAMIKILKHGNVKGITYKVRCKMCGCKFKFNDSDIKNEWHLDPRDHVSFTSINCPECNAYVYFEK